MSGYGLSKEGVTLLSIASLRILIVINRDTKDQWLKTRQGIGNYGIPLVTIHLPLTPPFLPYLYVYLLPSLLRHYGPIPSIPQSSSIGPYSRRSSHLLVLRHVRAYIGCNNAYVWYSVIFLYCPLPVPCFLTPMPTILLYYLPSFPSYIRVFQLLLTIPVLTRYHAIP